MEIKKFIKEHKEDILWPILKCVGGAIASCIIGVTWYKIGTHVGFNKGIRFCDIVTTNAVDAMNNPEFNKQFYNEMTRANKEIRQTIKISSL